MATNFLWSKTCAYVLLGLALGVTSGAMAYAKTLSAVETVALNTDFYYLVSEETRIEVSAELIKLEGGAGYLLQEKDGDCVALNVYLSEKDANSVLRSINGSEKNLSVKRRSSDKLYLKTLTDKKNALTYKGAFDSLYGCMQVIENCAFRLENGMTQESCKRILKKVQGQLGYLSAEYKNSFPDFATLCENKGNALGEILEDIVYLKDLRYVLCEMAGGYVALTDNFKL